MVCEWEGSIVCYFKVLDFFFFGLGLNCDFVFIWGNCNENI